MPSVVPNELMASLKGITGFDEGAFLLVHREGVYPTSIRLNPQKKEQAKDQLHSDLETSWTKVPWCKEGYYLSQRPSFILEPSWHTGRFYVQEASSMFLEQAFLQHASEIKDPRILDACAAPGGKSTHLQSLIGDKGLLVSNEVIRQRVGILSENLQRWGGANVVITSNDPRDFEKVPGFFDVMLIDAPCSGSGLFRREPEAVEEWSPANVELCGARQERILSDLWQSLKEGGLLIYSTCSYSPRENEHILDWISSNFNAESLALSLHTAWGVVETRSEKHHAFGYRFYPYLLPGEGLFMACFRKTGGGTLEGDTNETSSSLKRTPAKSAKGGRPNTPWETLGKKDIEILKPWVNSEDFSFIKTGETIRAVPENILSDLSLLASSLQVRESGVAVGQLMRYDLVPDPALALSAITAEEVSRLELSKDEALAYVRKDELNLSTTKKGWTLATYQGLGLGWMKVLEGRINNYYPKQWRVLKR